MELRQDARTVQGRIFNLHKSDLLHRFEQLNNHNMNTSKELATANQTNLAPFQSADNFQLAQRIAQVFAQSDMVPTQYKNNIGNCIIALEMANRIGSSPLMVMQNLYVIQGKPSWSSTFLIATLNACGKFSPLRYEEDANEGGRTRAYALDKSTGETLCGAWVSMEMAKAEGWTTKGGSKWKSMPELMRRYRAASFFTRQFAPEISMGLQTYEEVIDVTGKVVEYNQATTGLTSLPESAMDKIRNAIKSGADEFEIRQATDLVKDVMSSDQIEEIENLINRVS
jgi:hypothetical protein